ncbi:MAG: helix-turn-helix transcriptional regulator [Dietzia sp.]
MSNDRSTHEQPALWDEEPPQAHGQNAAQRRPTRPTKTAPPHSPTSEPQPPTAIRQAQPTHPELDVQDLWDADRVAAYLGVPKQTLYGWRHSGNGPKAFRVGKHLRWHPRTVVEWTFALERDQ